MKLLLCGALIVFGACMDGGAGIEDKAEITQVLDSSSDLSIGDTVIPTDEGDKDALPEVDADTTVDADSGIGEGGFGYPCENNDDCNSGYCVPTSDGDQCTKTCDSDCPADWACKPVGSEGDVTYICVPQYINLCRPCLENTDCTGALGGVSLGSRCAHYPTQGWFCASACSDGDCPNGYRCQDVESKGGEMSAQCVSEAGECSCTPYFIALGAQTWCQTANDFGTCIGQVKCEASGMSSCDAAEATAEVCDEHDNDCDEDVDEDIPDEICSGEENEFGSCEGVAKCVEGEMVCDAGEATKEVCDGLDNNCSGVADDGFDDTDEDGTADCFDADDDDDGVEDDVDNCPLVSNPDQTDTDSDDAGDACDSDDDGDGVDDATDSAPLDPNLCGVDQDGDQCDDCVNGTAAPDNDGLDTDADGLCDAGDSDDDDDGCADEVDDQPLTVNGDTDLDGTPDDCDQDDDNDGIVDNLDSAPLDPNVCGLDADSDSCDDCASGANNPADDGLDTDGDGLCDAGDPDDDGDGVADDGDSQPLNNKICGVDVDNDTCDDCFSGSKDPSNDGTDTDGDGVCDAGDDDDDNDGLPDGEDCKPLDPIACYEASCKAIKVKTPDAGDGAYTIDPDGNGGEVPFEVTCDMTTDGGGWTQLSLNDSDNVLVAEYSAGNPWRKCDDDSGKHFAGLTENAITVDYSSAAGEYRDEKVALSYTNPTTANVYTDAQVDALRLMVTQLNVNTRMVALTSDDDSGEWQDDLEGSGHEVYIQGKSEDWILLTPGEDGQCGGSSSWPFEGSESGYYLWNQSADGSVVDGQTGLSDSDLPGLSVDVLLPTSVRLVVQTGGGVAFGWEKPIFLVR